MDRGETTQKINENVMGCNACYVHGPDLQPLTAIINPSKIIVITSSPEHWMKNSSDFLISKEYSELNVYFGDSWLTRPLSPLSHTFAVKCPLTFFVGTRSNPSRCRMHTVDYVIGLNFAGVIAIGEEAKSQLGKVIKFGEIKVTKNGRLTLSLKYPSQSSIQEISSSLVTIDIFKDKINSM